MIRKFNYTDRVKIRREDISIKLTMYNEDNWFDADLSKLKIYNLPDESLVFLEAYRMTSWMRFSFGRLGKLSPPKNLHLSLFDTPMGIKFRVKVTASGDIHKLLAEANAVPLITPEQENHQKNPLLDVVPTKKLGDEIYRVGFSESNPILYLNLEVGNYKIYAKSPAFLSLALPAIVREILTKILIVDEWTDDTDMENWRSRWIRFIKLIPGIDDLPQTSNAEEYLDWIQDSVAVFAKRQKLKAQFKEFWRDEL